MKINWANTKEIPGCFGELTCACGELLSSEHFGTECTTVAELFNIESYCRQCEITKTMLEWLGYDKAKKLYTAICLARTKWPPGIWNSTGSSEDVDVRLDRLRDENLARAFG